MNTIFDKFLFLPDFNQDGKPDNITFMIKRIKVHTLDALKDPAYRFPNNYGVEKYLELFSGNMLITIALSFPVILLAIYRPIFMNLLLADPCPLGTR